MPPKTTPLPSLTKATSAPSDKDTTSSDQPKPDTDDQTADSDSTDTDGPASSQPSKPKSSTSKTKSKASSKREALQLTHPSLLPTLLSLLSLEASAETSQNAALLTSTPPTLLARAGLALLNLCVTSSRTGLGGRTVLELGLDPAVDSSGKSGGGSSGGKGGGGEGKLPEHGIRTGDVVRVSERKGEGRKKKAGGKGVGTGDGEGEKEGVEGVVVRVGEKSVQVALGRKGREDEDDGVEGLGGRLWIVKLANDIPNRRMHQALTTLLRNPTESYNPLQQILLGLSQPIIPTTADLTATDDLLIQTPTVTTHLSTLNPSQRSAIIHALTSPHLSLIHGPPGTGKTATLIAFLLTHLALHPTQRILVCGPSNISVDNIVARLATVSPSTKTVRVGHPARLLPEVIGRSLEVQCAESEQRGLVKDVAKEIEERVKEVRSGKTKGRGERGKIWGEVRELRKEYREREGRVVGEVVKGAGVVFSTLHGAGGRDVVGGAAGRGGEGFDVVVVDEAAQGVEPGCWIPVVMAGGGKGVRKLVLAGDHLQLPPTVKGLEGLDDKEEKKRREVLERELRKMGVEDEGVVKAANGWTLERTMFDRLLGMYGEGIKRLLNMQYRMHERIMRFPSDELYGGELAAAEGVEGRLLMGLEYEVEETEDTQEPLVFYDTQGGDFPEKVEDVVEDGKVKKSVLLGDSKSNEMEAAVVKMHVQNLIAAGVKEEDIAVITPYNAQLAVLSGMLRDAYPGLEMGSVDGFQGREKEAVIVSLVRSNPEHEVGFLGEKRRLNVAMTRPKRHLCVIGDSETVSRGSTFLKRWMKFLEENADLRYPSMDELDLT